MDVVMQLVQYAFALAAVLVIARGKSVMAGIAGLMVCGLIGGFGGAIPVDVHPWAAVFAGELSAEQLAHCMMAGVFWTGGIAMLGLVIAPDLNRLLSKYDEIKEDSVK